MCDITIAAVTFSISLFFFTTSARRIRIFTSTLDLKLKEEISKMLYLEHGFV
jgi:hypothetical protein